MAYNFGPNAGLGHHADVAELADALASGASGGNPVEVQILSSALYECCAIESLGS